MRGQPENKTEILKPTDPYGEATALLRWVQFLTKKTPLGVCYYVSIAY